MRAGQVSIEYLIITGTIIFLLILPAALFLSSFTRSNLQGTLRDEKANELGASLVDSAKQTYYMGLYAKKQVVVNLPENTDRFYILEITNTIGTYHYIVMVLNDGVNVRKYLFQSDVPLYADPATSSYVKIANYASDIAECGAATCTFTEFTNQVTYPGKKQFEIETVRQGTNVVVKLTPII